MFEIKLTNSLSKKKEIFVPLRKNELKIYVCGITPYDYSHLGHGRSYVNFDVLVRLFKFLGYDVNYVRNFTDIDDKILNKAQQLGNIGSYKELANEFIEAYHQDLAALGCLSPNSEPRVTEYVPQIIIFIKELLKNKNAYVIDSDVYYDISTFNNYGKLSGRSLYDQQAGARIEVDFRKKNPEDFVLWKGNNDEMFWNSPWGYGRPGWHIECSVMASELLGKTVDIHGGGADLIFPHHENEIAQSEGLHGCVLANYWLHNAFITINKEKMSKSFGNFVTLKDIFKKFDPMILRYFFLQHHYRTPIDFNCDELNASQTAYKKLVAAFGDHQIKQTSTSVPQNEIALKMFESLCDDLNTPKLIGLIFENLSEIKANSELINFTKSILVNILGFSLKQILEEQIEITPQIQELINQREQARRDKNWALSDKLRDQLKVLGYEIRDTKIKL
ncbi:MAG: Cysteine-tRNA ligase [candidate division TM6 bacterium GW2011_GWF2_37_49]|nr:MAG: Cysteine-tRNA ligase [candidate division TM6 bacterium GW2011_GWF2_37_49]